MNTRIDTKSKLFLAAKSAPIDPGLNKSISEVSILIVDDDNDDVLIISELFEESFPELDIKLEHADNYEKALSLLETNHYDLAFLDYRIGHENGLDLFRKIIAAGIEVPVVMATGQGDERTAVDAMKLGATDYMIKSEINAKSLAKLMQTVFGYEAKAKSQVFLNQQANQNTHSFFQKLDDAIVPKTKRVFSTNQSNKEMIQFFLDFDLRIKSKVL
ncbi:MAG: response regulator [Cyanobacteria bacterium]|nr:response regulator [Cyanobacteriota bacterium]MDA1020209.1 response regulator [Cyanobacteriota bacterium]